MSAKKLVLSMLTVDPEARTTAKEALQSEWMNTKDAVLRRKSLDKSLAEICSFNARRRLKGAIGAVIYAVGMKSFDIGTTAVWREEMHDSSGAVAGERETSNPETPLTFEELYKLDKKLQEGVYASVWKGTSVESDKKYAIKVIKRGTLSQSEDAAVLNEVSILKSLRHKHIVPLLDFLERPDTYYLVMKKCSGGDVLDR